MGQVSRIWILSEEPSSVEDVNGFLLDKRARLYVIRRLEKAGLLCGYEQDLLTALRESKCRECHGSGLAPYVGGDDDDSPCSSCEGTGFGE